MQPWKTRRNACSACSTSALCGGPPAFFVDDPKSPYYAAATAPGVDPPADVPADTVAALQPTSFVEPAKGGRAQRAACAVAIRAGASNVPRPFVTKQAKPQPQMATTAEEQRQRRRAAQQQLSVEQFVTLMDDFED